MRVLCDNTRLAAVRVNAQMLYNNNRLAGTSNVCTGLDSGQFGIPGHDGGERREHADEGAHSEPGGALCYSRQDKSLQRMSAN